MKDYSALAYACQYFANKDRMNAATHMGPVRYSPITFALVNFLHHEAPGWVATTEGLAEVMEHRNTYPLDHGR